MANQLKMGSFLSYVTIGLNILVSLLYTPFLLRMLGKEEYGLFSLASSIIAYLTILDLGFGNAIVRYMAKYRAEGKKEEQSRLIGMFLLIYSGISLLVIIIGTVLICNAELLFSAKMSADEVWKVKVMLSLMVGNLAFTFPMSIFGSVLTAYEQFVFPKLVNLVRIILNPLIMVILLCYGYKAIAMVVLLTIFNLLTLTINAVYCRAKVALPVKFGRFKADMLREVLVYSVWLFLNAIMDKIYYSSGQLVLGMFCGAGAVAVYALAIQLQHLYISLSSSISGVFLPRVTSMYTANQNNKEISDLFIKIGRIQCLVLLPVLLGFILFGKPFLQFWAGKGYEDTYWITLLFYVPGFIPLIENLGIVILQARNQMKFRAVSFLVVAVMCLLLSVPLAQRFDGIGFAIGTSLAIVISQGVVINIYYYKKIGIDVISFFAQIARLLVAPVGLTMVCGFALCFLSIGSVASMMAYGAVFAVLYVAVAYSFCMNQYEKQLFASFILSFDKRRK